jgi:CRP-like cAMP-binding protein
MMKLSAAREILAGRGWLAATPDSFRNELLARTELREVPRNHAIYRSGDAPGGLWGLAAGGVAVEVAPADRGSLLGHFAGPGFWIGAGPRISRQPRQVGLIATRRSVLLHLPIVEFEAIAAGDPQAWRFLAMLPVQQTLLATGVAEDLMIRDPRRRLWAILLRLASHVGQDESFAATEITASQDDLAGIVNLSRNAVGQMLRSFEADGLIERRYRRIRLLSVRPQPA